MNPEVKVRIAIEYCSQCRFILRASWIAQELLFTFGETLGEVALVRLTEVSFGFCWARPSSSTKRPKGDSRI